MPPGRPAVALKTAPPPALQGAPSRQHYCLGLLVLVPLWKSLDSPQTLDYLHVLEGVREASTANGQGGPSAETVGVLGAGPLREKSTRSDLKHSFSPAPHQKV